MSWQWLENPARPARWAVMIRVALKALILFALVNVVYAALDPLDALGRVSVYNWLVPGRDRMVNSYHENVNVTYQSSVTNIPALVASNKAAAPKPANEFRILVLGDSGTRGNILSHQAAFTYHYNQMQHKTDDGRDIVMYNLAHPRANLFKDFLILEEGMRQNYQPDMIIWMMAFGGSRLRGQHNVQLVRDNAQRARLAVEQYAFNISQERLVSPTFWKRTLTSQRRLIANVLRLQTFGFAWAATRYDGDEPVEYLVEAAEAQIRAKEIASGTAETLSQSHFAFEIIDAATALLGDIPLLVINEPIHTMTHPDNPLVLNMFYRRDSYEQYQLITQQYANEQSWYYVDLWDAIPPEHFTDSPLHYNAEGARILAERLADIIPQMIAEDAR